MTRAGSTWAGTPKPNPCGSRNGIRRPDFGHLELEVTYDDPKTFTKPFTVRTVKPYVADTEIFEDVCENERDREHLTGGFKVAPEVLAKYAGTYQLPGRDVVVEISGDKLIVQGQQASQRPVIRG